jgi:predicted MFS family arabinose efflux permease
VWERAAALQFTRERGRDDLWGYCAECYYGDECKGGCSWTAHVTLGRIGNNPFCHHRALEYLRDGVRERLRQVQKPDGTPFDYGVFEPYLEPWPDDELAHSRRLAETGEGFLLHTERVIALAFSLGVIDTLNLNARITLLPTLVPKPMIARAIALQALGVNVVQISGPSLAGVIIGEWDVAGCLVANAITFGFALASLAVIRPTTHEIKESPSVRDALREGFAFVRARPLLMGGIALAWLHGFFGVSVVRLYALFARSVLHADGRRYGLLAACGGLGAILASVLVTARARASTLRRNIAYASVFFSLAVLSLAAATTYPVAIAVVMALGAGQMAFRSAVSTAIQTETPDRLRGRVMSLLTLDFSLWSFGALAIGALGDGIARSTGLSGPQGLRWAFVAGGVICAICAAVIAPKVLRAKTSDAV